MIGLIDVTSIRTVHCTCPCHVAQWAEAARARHFNSPQMAFVLRQQGNTSPIHAPLDASPDGVIAAAVACDSCRNRHCAVFGPPPRDVTPWVDPPQPATGCYEEDGN